MVRSTRAATKRDTRGRAGLPDIRAIVPLPTGRAAFFEGAVRVAYARARANDEPFWRARFGLRSDRPGAERARRRRASARPLSVPARERAVAPRRIRRRFRGHLCRTEGLARLRLSPLQRLLA